MTAAVKRAALLLECSQHCIPALIVVSVSGKTWFGTPFACNYEDHPVTHRGESDITSVELAALLRKALAFFGCRKPAVARVDPNLAHRRYVRRSEFGRRGKCGGAGETDPVPP